jgi:hypothetical protein
MNQSNNIDTKSKRKGKGERQLGRWENQKNLKKRIGPFYRRLKVYIRIRQILPQGFHF